MKRMKKRLCLVLVLVLAASCLAGCGETARQKGEKLAGRWVCTMDDVESEARSLLISCDFYEEEIALCDLTDLDYVLYVQFDREGNYRLGYDTDGTRACVRDYLDRCLEAMYEGRSTLNQVYGEEFDSWTREEFRLFYAEIYGFESDTTMLDAMAADAYDYEAIGTYETGTFLLRSGKLLCTITGETEGEYLGYKLDGDALTLEYVDETQHFTRDK